MLSNYPFGPHAIWKAWTYVYMTTPMISSQKYLLLYESVYQILRQIAMGQRAFARGGKNLFFFALTDAWMCILHRFSNFCLQNVNKSWNLHIESYCCSRRFQIHVTGLWSSFSPCLIINTIKILKIVVIQRNESKRIKLGKWTSKRKRLEIRGTKKRVRRTSVRNTTKCVS